MMQRSNTLRHTILSRDPAALAEQCAENARDTIEALGTKVTGYLKHVRGYRTTGDPFARISIARTSAPPAAVILVRIAPTESPSGIVAHQGTFNFYYVNGEVGVYEPLFIPTGVLVDMTFLVLEG